MFRFRLLLITAFAAALAVAGTPVVWAEKTVPLSELYTYDPTLPLEPELEVEEDTPLHTVYHVTFRSTNNERVPALLGIPKRGQAPYPCVIIGHGYGGSKNDARIALTMLGTEGYCVMGIDAQYHGERKRDKSKGYDIFGDYLFQNRDALVQSVIDMRRAYDYLLTRPDVDPNKIGYVGASMGAIMGSLFLGVDKRPAAGVLIVGGGGWEEIMRTSAIPPAIRLRSRGDVDVKALVDHFQVVEPLNFIAEYSPKPLLFINGLYDNIVPAATGKALFEAAKEPKEIEWYKSGHLVPPDKVLIKVRGWLKSKFRKIEDGKPAPQPKEPALVEKLDLEADVKLVNDGKQWPTLLATAKTVPATTEGVTLEVGLSGIGHLPMYDTGNEGDAKANDGVYTFRIEVPIEAKGRKGELVIRAKNAKGETLVEKKFPGDLSDLQYPEPPEY